MLKKKKRISFFLIIKKIHDRDNMENIKKGGKGIITYNHNSTEIAIVSTLIQFLYTLQSI